MKRRLNLFQAMMLRWRDLHPYVAVHMVSIAHPLDAAKLKAHIAQRLEAAGLTGLSLDHRRKRQSVWLMFHTPMPIALYLVWNWGVP